MSRLSPEQHVVAVQEAMQTLDVTAMIHVRPDEPEDGVRPDGVVPADVVRYLARLRLLEGVPFCYLVPDAAMLPPESIRFFYLDRNWTDALVQGALAVGTVSSSDRAKLEKVHRFVRDEVDTAERLVRVKDADRPALDAEGRPIGVGGEITGFLLRSRIVSGWPGLHVRAYATDTRPDDETVPEMDASPDRVRVLRLERLAPAVLLVLFDGVPAVVHVEEPRSGIQFGVRVTDGDGGRASATTSVRDIDAPNDGAVRDGAGEQVTVDIPFRPDAPGVIDLAALERLLVAETRTNLEAPLTADQLAIELLRFPVRQVFGDPDEAPEMDAFRPTVPVKRLEKRYEDRARRLERGGQP